ncbi:MAG: hypothetical protein V1808_01525 [Candidatus Daviesbacteria bacterium]
MNELYTNTRVRVNANVIVHLRRQLAKTNAKIRVSQGQEVLPEDILGEGPAPSGFRSVHLAQELKTSPSGAKSCLARNLGQNIYQGELLASKRNLFGFGKKIVLSPVDGILDVYDEKSGELRIKLLPKIDKLVSGLYGIVDEIDASRGIITLRTQATLIHGILGSGKEREGLLRIFGSSEELISSKQISPDFQNQIIVGGGIVFADALAEAVNIGVAGFISGGINAGDYKAISGGKWNIAKKDWSDVGITVMITEGFGAIPIGDDIFKVCKENEGKFVMLNGNLSTLILPSQNENSMMYIRKTQLPKTRYPRLQGIQQETDLVALKIGAIVRLISGSWMGIQGKVEAIDNTATKLPSGIITYLVTVATRSRKVRMPYNNIEIIG